VSTIPRAPKTARVRVRPGDAVLLPGGAWCVVQSIALPDRDGIVWMTFLGGKRHGFHKRVRVEVREPTAALLRLLRGAATPRIVAARFLRRLAMSIDEKAEHVSEDYGLAARAVTDLANIEHRGRALSWIHDRAAMLAGEQVPADLARDWADEWDPPRREREEAPLAPPTRLEAAVPRLAAALRRAADEHGRPNTFGPRELREYGGPPAMIAGRIGKRFDLMQRVWALLGHRKEWGSCPRYEQRRFAV
jgi:hypothetical protein